MEFIRMNEMILRENRDVVLKEVRKALPNEDCNVDQLFAVSYLAYLIQNENFQCENEVVEFINKNFPEDEGIYLKDSMRYGINAAFEVAKKFEHSELTEYLLSFVDRDTSYSAQETETPLSIIKLVLRLMGISKGESVADFGCGMGCFLSEAIKENQDVQFFGVDIDTTLKQIASLKCKLLTENVCVEQKNMFALCNSKRFDKVFSNYPFGTQLRNLKGGTDHFEEIKKSFPDIVKVTSSDWIFNSLLISCLKEKGKAYAIMTNGSTWNSIDKPIREYFVRKGFIEMVISLPANMFAYTNIPTTLIVMSKGNKGIRMVDVSKVYEAGRRQNTFSEENVNRIIELISGNNENSAFITAEKIEENDFVISPSRYLAEEIEVKYGVEFGSVIKRITRGAPLRADELDEMVSEEPTMCQYLMLANIKNGIIDDNLPYLKEIDAKYEKYLIRNNNLLLSKNGAPFKVAVAEVEEEKRLLGNGNLYIIELDEEKINPYYLKAFFESEIGGILLKRIAVGASMPNIAVDSLKKIKVPMPSLEKQKKVIEKTMAKMDEVKILRLKLEKAIQSMKTFFEEE